MSVKSNGPKCAARKDRVRIGPQVSYPIQNGDRLAKMRVLTVFALTFLDHLSEKEKKGFYNCNIPIPDENVTCPNQKQLVRGVGQVGYGEDC